MARTAGRHEPKYLTMRCRSCGQDIASNAIVCYKCGTPTADVPAPRRAAGAGGRTLWLWIALGAMAAAAVAAWLAFHRA
jgi:hypothetical protein